MSDGKASRNERRKAVATTLNAIGVASFIGSILQALLGQSSNFVTFLVGLAIFTGTQGALHAVLKSIEY
ncbi:MAG: hypothetical protein JNJ73_08200 [Hyphomonadaceae bacterium]|nr:hypothetical protein [Hyphomonadaceae bacterium]